MTSVFRRSLLANQDEDMWCESMDGLSRFFGCGCDGDVDNSLEVLDEHGLGRSWVESAFIVGRYYDTAMFSLFNGLDVSIRRTNVTSDDLQCFDEENGFVLCKMDVTMKKKLIK